MRNDESLIAAKAADNFTTESPIRAFTEFKVAGLYAIGKGFRPSLARLTAYLDAMENKEGWELVQVILPRDGDGDPTILFRRRTVIGLIGPSNGEIDDTPHLAGTDDPINPKHYDGRACADIGECLSANGYQILKYVWRLGKKGDALEDINKAIWYCESEIALLKKIDQWAAPETRAQTAGFFEDRISDQPQFTKDIAWMLWKGYGPKGACQILQALCEHRFHLSNGSGLAV